MENFDKLIIKGGKPLKGKIYIRGAKNFVPKGMVASLLGNGQSILNNVPEVSDVEIVSNLLRVHGVQVQHDRENAQLKIDPTKIKQPNLDEVVRYSGSSRIPILFCGPLLHKLGHAVIPNLGGCIIGDRPIGFHLEALREFGAIEEKSTNGIKLKMPKGGLKGAKIALEYPSVGATEQVLLTAVLAKGTTELTGAAIEPEIIDLISLLQKMGAIISIETDRRIIIEGVETLNNYNHFSIYDRNEAASWACAALATKGDIFVDGAIQQDLTTFLNHYRKIGGEFSVYNSGIRFWANPNKELESIALQTGVHPGFMTDWQQPFVVVLTQAKGLSIVHETVYEKRFGFTKALQKMGATIQLYRDCLGGQNCRFGQRNYEHSAVISGPTKLKGANIVIPDLRGGISHIIAALSASGTSEVSGVSIINRGYEHFAKKLEKVEAEFEIK